MPVGPHIDELRGHKRGDENDNTQRRMFVIDR